MSVPENWNCLRDKRVFLLDNLDPDRLSDYLYQLHVISYKQLEEVRVERKSEGKNVIILDCLQRRPVKSTFPVFLRCLRSSNQHHIAKALEEYVIKETSTSETPPRDGLHSENHGIFSIVNN